MPFNGEKKFFFQHKFSFKENINKQHYKFNNIFRDMVKNNEPGGDSVNTRKVGKKDI